MKGRPIAFSVVLCAAGPALAHTGGATQGFPTGFLHPFSGLDHVLAMAAVGLWAGLVGGRAVWAWPLAFMAVMVVGALAGLSGSTLPGGEIGIALSVVVLGAFVAARAPLPVVGGILVCGVFAFSHGHAHGAELRDAAGAVAGFTAATALLHGAGIALGLTLGRKAVWAPRLAGGAMALTGIALLVGAAYA